MDVAGSVDESSGAWCAPGLSLRLLALPAHSDLRSNQLRVRVL